MKAYRLILAAVASVSLLACNKGEEPFRFRITADSVREGESLPVHLTIEKGPIEGYRMESIVASYDIASDTENGTRYALSYDGGAADKWIAMDFPNSGHRDFKMEGLKAGTYRITVSLDLDGSVSTMSTTAVVMRPGIDDSVKPDPGQGEGGEGGGEGGGGGGGGGGDDKPVIVKVTSFSLPKTDPEYGKVCVGINNPFRYFPEITPENATDKTFAVSSSNPDVVTGECVNGEIILTGVYPGTATISVTSDGGTGITRSFPVMVYADVTVTEEFYEVEATELQQKTKTFPCVLKISSDCPVAFPQAVTYDITMKAVVNVSGKDTRSVTSHEVVSFSGKRAAVYNITEKVLIPAYDIYATNDFSLSLTLSVQRNNKLDPTLWRLTFVEKYKEQTCEISKYLTSNQQ